MDFENNASMTIRMCQKLAHLSQNLAQIPGCYECGKLTDYDVAGKYIVAAGVLRYRPTSRCVQYA